MAMVKIQIAIGYVEDHVLDGGEIHIFEPDNRKVGRSGYERGCLFRYI